MHSHAALSQRVEVGLRRQARAVAQVEPLQRRVLREQAQQLAGCPLDAIGAAGLADYVVHQSRAERGFDAVSSELPFDVTKHPNARSHSAGVLLGRLRDDVAVYSKALVAEGVDKVADLTELEEADWPAIFKNLHRKKIIQKANAASKPESAEVAELQAMINSGPASVRRGR